MILYTIDEYMNINLKGLKSALLNVKGDRSLIEILQESHDSSDDSDIKTDTKRVINAIQKVLEVKE